MKPFHQIPHRSGSGSASVPRKEEQEALLGQRKTIKVNGMRTDNSGNRAPYQSMHNTNSQGEDTSADSSPATPMTSSGRITPQRKFFPNNVRWWSLVCAAVISASLVASMTASRTDDTASLLRTQTQEVYAAKDHAQEAREAPQGRGQAVQGLEEGSGEGQRVAS